VHNWLLSDFLTFLVVSFLYNILTEITAEICGVPTELVKNLSTIWGALSCGFDLDPDKFGRLCEETEQIYFDKDVGVGWFSLPPTLHKIFKHGKQIIISCPLPIGLTNEEASEANNKFLRRFRLHHTRKTSWRDGVQDLFHRLMDISDPIVQETPASQAVRNRARRILSPQILSLLKTPDNSTLSTWNSLSENESDE
jgi:hypothetical protein